MTSGESLASVGASGPQAAGADTMLKSSRLTHLLASNDVPLDSEIPIIRQIISDANARVDALDAQIAVLRNALEELIRERDEIQECARKHTAVVSPIRYVPPEVMGQIFALTLPHTRQIGEETVDCPPWPLGHICRSWRDFVLVDPFLWCSIVIYHRLP
ncbi:hypothetical protein C8R44DRAFT_695496, partial [Mycena epipterygia]